MKLKKTELALGQEKTYEATLELPRISEEVLDVVALSPVLVDVTAVQVGQQIHVSGHLKATVTYRCSRCLRNFEQTLATKFEEKFTLLEREGTEELHYVPEPEIDLVPFIEEAIFLSLDLQPVCGPGCKGLCPVCGTNLNENTCDCDISSVDPRLEALKDLLSNGDSE